MTQDSSDVVDQIMAEQRSQPPTRHDYYSTDSTHRMDCRLCKYEYEQEQADLERLRAMEEERGA